MDKARHEAARLWLEVLGGAVVGFAAAAGVWQAGLYIGDRLPPAAFPGGGEASTIIYKNNNSGSGSGKWYVGDPTAEPQPVPGYNPYVQYRAPDTNPCSNGRVWTEWCGCQSPQYGSDC